MSRKNIRLIHSMEERGLSTLELARQIGVCPSLISLIRRGWRRPTCAQVAAIEKALGASDIFEASPRLTEMMQ